MGTDFHMPVVLSYPSNDIVDYEEVAVGEWQPKKQIAWQPGDGAFRKPQVADKAARRYLRASAKREAKP